MNVKNRLNREEPAPDAPTLRIGEVAEMAGVTPRTIRYYEEIGLLPTVEGRSPGSHRLYHSEDAERLIELIKLKELLNVSLEELKEMVAVNAAREGLRREWRSGVDDPERQRQILDQSVEHIDHQLTMVRRRRDEIATLESDLLAQRRKVKDRLRSLMRYPASPH